MTQKDQITTKTGNQTIAPKYATQVTFQYKTFLKRAVSEAIQNGLKENIDKNINGSKAGIEYKTDRQDFPNIVVKFYEKDIKNAGVGHEEWGPSPADPHYSEGKVKRFIKYYHRIYRGDLQFEIYALSSLDRDKVSDALLEILTMGNHVSVPGTSFQQRLYESIGQNNPYSEYHFIAVNQDDIKGYGEQSMVAPWWEEDVLVYQTTYRMPVLGEFYSYTPKLPPSDNEFISEIDIYPWDDRDPLDTPPEDFPEGVVPDKDYIKITKHHKVTKEEEHIYPSDDLFPSDEVFPE